MHAGPRGRHVRHVWVAGATRIGRGRADRSPSAAMPRPSTRCGARAAIARRWRARSSRSRRATRCSACSATARWSAWPRAPSGRGALEPDLSARLRVLRGHGLWLTGRVASGGGEVRRAAAEARAPLTRGRVHETLALFAWKGQDLEQAADHLRHAHAAYADGGLARRAGPRPRQGGGSPARSRPPGRGPRRPGPAAAGGGRRRARRPGGGGAGRPRLAVHRAGPMGGGASRSWTSRASCSARIGDGRDDRHRGAGPGRGRPRAGRPAPGARDPRPGAGMDGGARQRARPRGDAAPDVGPAPRGAPARGRRPHRAREPRPLPRGPGRRRPVPQPDPPRARADRARPGRRTRPRRRGAPSPRPLPRAPTWPPSRISRSAARCCARDRAAAAASFERASRLVAGPRPRSRAPPPSAARSRAGRGRDDADVRAALAGLEAWGDRRVLAYCLADLAELAPRADRGRGACAAARRGPGRAAALVLTDAAAALLADGPWEERWAAAMLALRPALPWWRAALVGGPALGAARRPRPAGARCRRAISRGTWPPPAPRGWSGSTPGNGPRTRRASCTTSRRRSSAPAWPGAALVRGRPRAESDLAGGARADPRRRPPARVPSAGSGARPRKRGSPFRGSSERARRCATCSRRWPAWRLPISPSTSPARRGRARRRWPRRCTPGPAAPAGRSSP